MFSVLITTFSFALYYTNPRRIALASALRRLACDITMTFMDPCIIIQILQK